MRLSLILRGGGSSLCTGRGANQRCLALAGYRKCERRALRRWSGGGGDGSPQTCCLGADPVSRGFDPKVPVRPGWAWLEAI